MSNSNKANIYFVNDYEELSSHILNKKYDTVYFDVMNSNMARVVCNYKLYNMLFKIGIIEFFIEITSRKCFIL